MCKVAVVRIGEIVYAMQTFPDTIHSFLSVGPDKYISSVNLICVLLCVSVCVHLYVAGSKFLTK